MKNRIWMIILLALTLTVSGVLAAGQAANDAKPADAAKPAVDAKAAADAKPAADAKAAEKKPDRVIATVNGEPIMFSQVDGQVDNFEAKFREINPKMTLPEDRRAKMRRDFLDRMIKDKIFEQAADKEKITVTDKEVDDRINQLQKIFGEGDEAKQRFLGGIKDMQEFRANIAKQIKIDKFVESRVKAEMVTDAEAKAYYDANISRFTEPEAVKLRHILWRLPPKESPDYKEKSEAVKKEAESVMKELKSGADFAAMARKVSQDKTTAEKGGELGWVQRGRMVKPFEDAAFALSKGEVSAPVQTAFGVHLIQVIDKKEGRTRTFAESKDLIIKSLQRKKAGMARDKLLKELRAKSEIKDML